MTLLRYAVGTHYLHLLVAYDYNEIQLTCVRPIPTHDVIADPQLLFFIINSLVNSGVSPSNLTRFLAFGGWNR